MPSEQLTSVKQVYNLYWEANEIKLSLNFRIYSSAQSKQFDENQELLARTLKMERPRRGSIKYFDQTVWIRRMILIFSKRYKLAFAPIEDSDMTLENLTPVTWKQW